MLAAFYKGERLPGVVITPLTNTEIDNIWDEVFTTTQEEEESGDGHNPEIPTPVGG